MALAPQSVYLAQARQVQALWNRWVQLYYDIRKLNDLQAKNGAQNVWKAMSTAAQGTNAAMGTADANPVNTDPITVQDASGVALGMTANDIINALNDLIQLTQVYDGTLPAASYSQVDHRGDAPSVSNLTS